MLSSMPSLSIDRPAINSPIICRQERLVGRFLVLADRASSFYSCGTRYSGRANIRNVAFRGAIPNSRFRHGMMTRYKNAIQIIPTGPPPASDQRTIVLHCFEQDRRSPAQNATRLNLVWRAWVCGDPNEECHGHFEQGWWAGM